MDPRVFRRVQRYGWDAATDAYDRGWVPLIEGLTESCVARAGLRPGERVLDLERHDMEATGAADGAFDAVTCAFGLMFAAERAAAFAEIARVTAPGGRVSVCVWGRRAACGFAEAFPIVDAHVESEVCPLFFTLGVPGALTASFGRAGLVDVVEESVSVTLSWASADEACQAMLEGGAVALAWSRFNAETRAVIRAEYLASLEPFRRGDRYDVAAEVMFATARKPA